MCLALGFFGGVVWGVLWGFGGFLFDFVSGF